MEVACGEHGDNVLRLVLALRRGLLDQVITSLVKPHSIENVNGASSRHASPGFLDSDLTIADERSPLVLGGMNNSNSECNPCRQNAVDQKRDETSVQLDFRCNGPSKKTESKAAGEEARHSRSFETSLLTQFRVLFVRSILSIVRDTLQFLKLNIKQVRNHIGT
ncbi:unnamed protein product [Dicrocoelium dendriticum]|nr:unnamed protein product [Dicrocoelium dendriticum]